MFRTAKEMDDDAEHYPTSAMEASRWCQMLEKAQRTACPPRIKPTALSQTACWRWPISLWKMFLQYLIAHGPVRQLFDRLD